MFTLKSNYQPAGDQPQAIEDIVTWFSSWKQKMTLLWATGTWKTFTMANVIKATGKPTLILSHNKTLAAQLATEFKYFFPDNAVHYFVSYFDYYQPESYLPEKGVYIEKEATINKEIEMFRLSTMASLLSREDTIVISSVSAIYGLGNRFDFEKNRLHFEVWKDYDFEELKKKLIMMQYKPVLTQVEQWMFDVQWEMVDVYSSTEKVLFRMIFNDTTLEYIQVKDSLTYELHGNRDQITIWPATQYMQNMENIDEIITQIEAELKERVAWFEKHGFLVEAQRIKKRVTYDIKMMKETGFVQGIENYSPYFEWRLDGRPPNTLFDYFPDDFLLMIDESHMTVPQLWWMSNGDKSRKQVLIDNWFRLPSAIHHRPINFNEIQAMLKWREKSVLDVHEAIDEHIKNDSKTLFVSATPSRYEIEQSEEIVQQIIRPTGLVDPLTYVYPKSWTYESLEATVEPLIKKNPLVTPYLDGYEKWTDLYL